MPESVAFEADSFEYLEASPGLALIRLAGRWIAEEERPLSNVELLVEGEGTTLSMAPLPGGGSPSAVARPGGTSWRGGFSVPLDLVSDRATRYALDAGKGAPIELPRLVRKDLEDQGGERTETPSESHASDLEQGELERRIGQAGDALAEARAEIERNRIRRAAMEEELRERFESESAARETLLRSEIERAHQEAEHERTARIEAEQVAAQLRDDLQRKQAEVAEIEREISQARERAERELQLGIESEREASATLAREEAAAGVDVEAEADAAADVEAEVEADVARKELDRTVKDQLGWTDRLLVRQTLKVLLGQLAHDERAALLVTGSFNRTSCLVVATDRRLLVIGEENELREEFPYDGLRAIRVAKKRFKRPRLELESGDAQVVVEEVTENVEQIRAYVAERIPADQLLPLGGGSEES